MKHTKNEAKESYTSAILKRPPKNLTLQKTNQRNFEDVSSENAIFDDIIKILKTLRAGAQF